MRRNYFSSSIVRRQFCSQIKKPYGYWNSKENGKEFVDEYERKWNVTEWFKESPTHFSKRGGKELLKRYGSILNLIKEVKPEKLWDPFLIGKYPSNHWKCKKNQRQFLDRIVQTYYIKNDNDWKNVNWNHIKKHGGGGLQRQYKDFTEMINTIYPEKEFHPLFSRNHKLPNNYWKDEKNRKEFINYLIDKYKISTPNDWKNITQKDIIAEGGSGIYREYNTLGDFIISEYPLLWNPILSQNKIKTEEWNDENKLQFMESMGKKLNIKNLDDWNNITKERFINAGGSCILNQFSSFFELLSSVYPEHTWNKFNRKYVPFNFWKEKKNHRIFLDKLAKKLNITKPEHWNNIKAKYIINNGGRRLFSYYPSIIEMLQENYPEHKFKFSDKHHFSKSYWKRSENNKKIAKIIENSLKIKNPEEWYRISYKQLSKLKLSSFIKRNGGLYEIAKKEYPDYQWDKKKFSIKDKRSRQREMIVKLKELYPNTEIIEDYICSEISRNSGIAIEFDAFIPSKNIAFEYHGEQHYIDIPALGSLDLYTQRDKEKEILCKENNIQLVIIPFWWDGNTDSLTSFISKEN